jgi:hypothetical protein
VIEELLESARESCKEGRITEDTSKSAQPILKGTSASKQKIPGILMKKNF